MLSSRDKNCKLTKIKQISRINIALNVTLSLIHISSTEQTNQFNRWMRIMKAFANDVVAPNWIKFNVCCNNIHNKVVITTGINAVLMISDN